MSVIFLIFLLIALAFLISALVGVIMFIVDINKYSSYKAELDNLKQKYSEKLDELQEISKTEVKENGL